MRSDDHTKPGTPNARKERTRASTKESAVTTAAARLTKPGIDIEEVLSDLFERAREQGRLQEREAVEQARLDAAEARERAARYSARLTEIRGTARRRRLDGFHIDEELYSVLWPKEDVG